MSKLIFIDIDGTLVDYDCNLPESAVKAVREARANGHKVYMCTGRSKAEVYPELWDIGMDGIIGGNGSYIEHHGKVVMHKLISLQECKHVVDWLHNRGLEFFLESNNGLFGSEQFKEVARPGIREYCKRKGMPEEKANQAEITDIFPEMIFGGELYRDDVNKISFLLNTYQDYLDAVEEFPMLQSGTWGGAGEETIFGDLGVKNITKGNAIEQLLKYLGASREDTIAFGDAKVDIPMLAYCNYGVAMGSGGEEIKAMADYVTDDVDQDGLYKAFEKLGLI